MFKFLLVIFAFISQTITYEVSQVSNVKTLFGESPFWCKKSQSLYYVDVFGQESQIFRFDYNENKVYSAQIIGESIPGFIIPIKGCANQFAVGLSDRKVKIIYWDGISKAAYVIRVAFEVEQDPLYSSNHWYNSKADPKGRFYGGTFRQELCSFSSAANASFYRYTKRKGIKRIMGNIKASNGLDWNVKAKKFYYNDGCNALLREYDWNSKTGTICNGRTIFQYYPDNHRIPSVAAGLTIDQCGNLYTGMCNGSSVWQINPKTKERLQVINLPTQIVNGVAFGGPKMDKLFVTTGSTIYDIYSGSPSNETLTSSAGALFMISGLGVKGFAGRKLCI